jgi:hypothetical protein
MSDLKSVLERSRERMGPSRLTPERVYGRRDRKQRNARVAAGVVGVAIAIAIVALGAKAAITNHQPVGRPSITPSDVGTLTITDAGCTLDGLANPGPGPFTLDVTNGTDGAKTVLVFKIASDARFARTLALVDRVRPRFGTADHRRIKTRFEYGNTSEMDMHPHESSVVTGTFVRGTYGIQCAGQPPERDRSSNFVGPIDVRSG